MTTKDLELRHDTALSAAAERPRGLEEASLKEDLIIPRSKLLQALSPEVAEGNGKAGTIINSLTKEVLPSEFIPVAKFYQWIRFNQLDPSKPGFVKEYDGNEVKPGELLWQSFNPYDPRVQAEGVFGANNEKPLATKFICFLSYFPGVDMPVVVSFSSTSLKAGKQLLTQLEFLKTPIWFRKFKLASKHVIDGQFRYYVLTVDPAGETSDAERTICEAWHSRYGKKADLDIDNGQTAAEDKGF